MSVAAFRHEALLYAGDAEFVQGTVPFVRQGLERREAVLVVEPARKIGLLRQELGEDAALVMFADMAVVGANPARIVPVWQDFVDQHGRDGGGVRGIGEPISAERPADELAECQRHESLLNVAFAGGRGWRLMCPYDVSALPPDVVEEARRSHQYVVERHVELPSRQFRGVSASAAGPETALDPPPAGATSIGFAAGDLGRVREIVAQLGAAAGLDAERTSDFIAAAAEVATNSIAHGGGSGALLAWHDGKSAYCEFRDAGRIANALADRERPRGLQAAGGLWLANQLCDLVQIRTGSAGTVVRLVMRVRNGRRGWSWPAV